MRRRETILLLGGSAAFALTAHAQQPPRAWRIGLLETTDSGSNGVNLRAFREGLAALGYAEGRDLVLEYRSADGQNARFAELAAELVRLNVDLILTRGTPAVLAAKNASRTIPIVMAASGEPFGTGVVDSLAQPGGNVTGLSSFNTELESKRIQLLLDIAPGTRRLGGLYNLGNPVLPPR